MLLTVSRADAGARLDRFLSRELHLTRDAARALVARGRVRIRGKACSPLRKLFGGEEIDVDAPVARPAEDEASRGVPVRVLYEDADCLVVDKPAGVPAEPPPRGGASMAGAVALRGGCSVGGRAWPGLPHRLDKDTTGCLLLAKTDRGLTALAAAFHAKQVKKSYLAIAGGDPPDAAELDTPYARDPDDARRFTSKIAAASGRRARLSFRVRERRAGLALLEVQLETGRTHQIRVQLADAGFPVLGDAVYGRPSPRLARQALHAFRLAFPRPSDGVLVEVESPLPPDIAALLA